MNLEYLKLNTKNKSTRALCNAIKFETGYIDPSDIRIQLYLNSIKFDLSIVRAILVDEYKLSYTETEWSAALVEFEQVFDYYKNYTLK